MVTPLGWFFPGASAGAAELEATCRKHGVTLHGTGIHPGGITERFPLMISALSRRIRHVRAEEFSDIRSYRAETVVRDVMLFGKPPEVAAEEPDAAHPRRAASSSRSTCWRRGLGFDLDAEKRTRHEMALATAPIETPVGALPRGTRGRAALHLAGHGARRAGDHACASTG